MAVTHYFRTAGAAVAEGWATHRELQERQALRRRPWEERFLHWSWDGAHWQLHGSVLPPAGRRRGITREGWCPRQGRTPAGRSA